MDYKNKTNILQTTSLRTFSPNSTNYKQYIIQHQGI